MDGGTVALVADAPPAEPRWSVGRGPAIRKGAHPPLTGRGPSLPDFAGGAMTDVGARDVPAVMRRVRPIPLTGALPIANRTVRLKPDRPIDPSRHSP